MAKNFNNDWFFRKEVQQANLAVTTTDWQPVTLPHDWLIADSNNLYETSIGYYKKAWDASDLQPGQRAILCFDGVYMDCELFVNSQLVGVWKYGYTAFHFDITDFINLLDPADNTIMLKVNYQSPNSRWYTGAGIYRDCYLLIKNSTRFAIDGIYINTKRHLNDVWHINVAAEVVSSGNETYTVQHKVDSLSVGIKTLPHGDIEFTSPQLWSLFNPVCYVIISELLVNGQVVDKVSTRFGFREIKFDPQKGFFLNGRNIKINGVCQHHDLGALGAAVHPDALRRQLIMLKSMGVNAIRTAHNPPAKIFMELADEMGFLIMSEISDMWKRPKNKYDYARFFEDWIEKDVAAWIRRDRNCPSIIMWSVGNEIYDTHADYVDGLLTLQRLVGLVRQHDPGEHAHITLCSNYMAWENTQKCVEILKLVGYNYAEYLYDEHHAAHPDWIIYGGETASTVQSRGVYHFPLTASVLSDDDLQCSSLGNSTTSWGAKSAEHCIKDHRDRSFIFGQFIWTGTDYIGEPTPYHTKNSYFGQIDTAGFPKDSYYIFKAGWTDHRRTPFVHILPYWDWSAGQPIDVRVCSNVSKVELFLNNKSLGVQDIDLVGNYIVPYESGTLRACAYARNGSVIAEDFRYSFGDAVQLKLHHTSVGELVFTDIIAVDASGKPVENANNRVNITITDGELLGTDNGDSTDRESYKSASKRLFNGKLLAISKPENGNFALFADLDEMDIPVRKIELTKREFTITAEIFPKNATANNVGKLTWRLTDANGIDSPLGTIKVAEDGLSAEILPKGDGEAYVRCAVDNERDHASIISVLPFTISGYGKPFLNPYEFVAGGLYNLSNEPMTNGNERGVATLRDRDSHVGFTDLDFGTDGSDEITLWLFPLQHEPFPIEIWLGMPEVGTHLCTVTYDKGSIWNTYQEVTYKLPKRLQGIATVSFLLRQKVHIKGFIFAKQSRAYSQIGFTENNGIYGDTFTVTPTAVEKIGNNVTITFSSMEFTNPAKTIEINSRSQQDKNSIRLAFAPENGAESVNMVTVLASEDYTSNTYQLETPLVGKGTLSFIFLPGCDIDLMWFRVA
ncbi:MAG: DUF4982 domain-containing protein [Defluviitaleaceae bacterium]|nr:DUF4982 domain-containing protein [Defluviitaleaceae bacterium]